MPKQSKPVVRHGRLHANGRKETRAATIPVGSAAWGTWLAAHDRFVFEGEHGRFTARREMRRGRDYWYAYRKRAGKLRKAYLGRTEELSLDRLQKADRKLAEKEHSFSASAIDSVDGIGFVEAAPLPALMATKLQPPLQPQHQIHRPRLTSRMTTSLTVIHAPGGFGKSVLLSQWRQENGIPAAWATLNADDNNPSQFWQVFIAALQTIRPSLGRQLSQLSPAPDFGQIQSFVTRLINQMTAESMPPFALILDDYHHITQDSIHESLTFFINHMPAPMRLLISSDIQFPFSLGQWRAAGILTELDTNDLRLTFDEGIAFLRAQPLARPLVYAEMRELVRQTGGWAAGLRLAALARQRQAALPSSENSLSQADVYYHEHFIENVLRRQETAVQTFLLQIAILKNLIPDLCAAVTGQENSEQLLNELWQANLFLTKFGGDSPRYQLHSLFAAVLQRELRRQMPDLVPDLHRRAARWHQAHDRPEEAVRHLLATNAWEKAAALIEMVALRELHEKGEDSRLLRWVQQLPVAVVRQHTSLLGVYLRLTNIALPTSRQAQFLQQVEDSILSKPAAERLPDEDAVLSEIGRLRQITAVGQSPPPESLVTGVYGDTFALMDTFAGGFYHTMQRNYPAAESVIAQVLDEAEASGNLFMMLLTGGTYVFLNILQGRLRPGEAAARQLLQSIYKQAGRWPEPTSMLFANLAWIAYERNQLAEAEQWLAKALDIDPNPTSANLPVVVYLLQARIRAAQGNFAAAQATIRAAFNLNPEMRSGMWTNQDLFLYQAWFHARAGEVTKANRLLAGIQVVLEEDLLELVQAEILLAQHEYALAEETLKQLIARFPYGLKTEPLLRPLLMLAEALFARNKINEAQKMMEKGLRLAGPEQLLRPFLDRGERIAPLLVLVEQRGRLTAVTRQFTRQLIQLFSATVETQMAQQEIDSLAIAASISNRELEVLSLVSAGYTNRAIAARLMVTSSTVNSHIKNIYRKLGVHNRIEAVAQAKALNLPLCYKAG